MEQQWKSILLPRLQDEKLVSLLASGFTKTITNFPKYDDNAILLTKALESFCEENSKLSDDQIAQLRLILAAFRACKGNLHFINVLLKSTEKKTQFAETVLDYYANSKASSLSESNANALRLLLFGSAPTAVIAGLVDARKITVVPAEAQSAVKTILVTAVRRGLNISKSSITNISQSLNLSSTEQKSASKCVAAIQRLHAVVTDPLHLSTLIRQEILSAHDIASTDIHDFTKLVGATGQGSDGIPSSQAEAIWKQASLVDMRNERAWADLIQQREDIPVLAFDKVMASDPLDISNPTLQNLFRENDSVEVDEYASVLSPAAYLVDLLQVLRYSYPDPSTKPNLNVPSRLLEAFLERRPDIRHIQLSKANTITLVKYADLVNEVLESFILSSSGMGSEVVIRNEIAAESDASKVGTDAVQSAYTAWSVYEKIMQDQVYPVKHFPFNLAAEAKREYLGALGVSCYDLYRLFRPRAPSGNGFMDYGTGMTEQQKFLLEQALQRRLAAEYLRLSAEEFVMICGEAFQSLEFLQELKDHRTVFSGEEYAAAVNKSSTSRYWGYETSNKGSGDDQMMGKVSGVSGLNNIAQGLLPRSGLSYTELLNLLKTEFVAKRFVINVENRKGNYSGKLEDMTLATWTDSHGVVILDLYLSVTSCAVLLSFIKLWKKLGWPLKDLDAALVTLALSRLSGSPATQNFTVDAEMITDLASIKRLSTIAQVDIDRLLPIWGPMRLEGLDPLYQRLFGSRTLLKQYPALALGKAGRKDAKFEDLLPPLLSALRISLEDYQNIVRMAGISTKGPWTLETVSVIYRYALFCSILDVPIGRYEQWLSLNLNLVDPWASPKITLEVVERWQELKAQGFSKELLLSVADLSMPNGTSSLPSNGPSVAIELLTAIESCKQKYAIYNDDTSSEESCSAVSLRSLLAEVFDVSTTEKIHSLLEGSWMVSAPTTETAELPKNDTLARKISIEPGVIKLRSMLTDAEMHTINRLLPEEKDTVSRLQSEWLVPKIALEQRSDWKFTGDSAKLLLPLQSTDAVSADAEGNSRRKSFIQLFAPMRCSAATRDTIITKISSLYPKQDSTLTASLLGETNESGVSLLSILTSLQESNDVLMKNSAIASTGYISVPSTDVYKFVAGQNVDCSLWVDSRLHRIQPGGSEDISLTQSQAIAVNLAEGNIVQGLTVTSSLAVSLSMSSGCFAHQTTVEAVSNILKRLSVTTGILNKLKLSASEFLYFRTNQINMLRLTMPDLQRIGAHIKARDIFSFRSKRNLIEFYHWCSDHANEQANQNTIAEQIASVTGLAKETTKSLLKIWSDVVPSSTAVDANVLLLFNEAASFVKNVPLSIETLNEWCALSLPKDTTSSYEAAKVLESVVSTRFDAKAIKACEKLAAKRRDVLVQYLLLQPKIGTQNIVDADSLFEYFLIDVQMGPQQETSRIKQAISTIQLFINRCLLGLERQNGIPTTAVKRSSWAWMSKFTLWQANRKVFLYPENWIDESLRDDRSQQFRTIEAVILQSNLSLEAINAVCRQYIYSANQIADLQIAAYYWQPGEGFQGRYHIFARTRTLPYIFYHRILEVTGVALTEIQYNWYPWFKLEVEIPAHEVDWDGKSLAHEGTYLVPSIYRDRLFLFIPQILLKPRPKPASSGASLGSTSFKDLAGKSVDETSNDQYWEIKMGWSENRNGEWSKKEISTSSIDVQGLLAPDKNSNTVPKEARGMPSVSTFQFRVSKRWAASTVQSDDARSREILVIDVYRWFEKTGIKPAVVTGDDVYKGQYGNVQLHVGRFELRGTQMVVSDYRNTSADWKHTPATYFSRMYLTTKAATNADLTKELIPHRQYNQVAGSDQQPLLALAPILNQPLGQQQQISWMVSYDEAQHSGASALVIERAFDSYVDSYFGIPVRDPRGFFSGGVREVNTVQQLTHSISQPLMEIATRTDDLNSIYGVLDRVPLPLASDAFGGSGKIVAKELATPYSIYNWELGFHLVLLLMERLLVTQQFELALQVANQVFDPRANDEAQLDWDGKSRLPTTTSQGQGAGKDKPLSNLDRCWKFMPFQNANLRLAGSTKSVVEGLEKGPNTNSDINSWLANPFNAHSVARNRPAIYMKRFVIKYIEILIAAGDAFFREDTLESLPLALQRYMEASQLFGPRPQLLPGQTKPVIKTFEDIRMEVNDFASAAVDMELEYPYFVEPSSRGQFWPDSPGYNSVLGMVRSSYFGVPANPQMVALRDLIDDRFFKIRNSLDINGNFRRLALFEPPLDPGELVRSVAGGSVSSGFAASVDGPAPTYRFVYLLQKAFEICAELKSLGDMYLSIKEKRDAEALAALRAQQDVSMSKLVMDTKQLQRDDARQALKVLEASRKSQEMRLEYYLALIGESKDKVPQEGKPWKEIQQQIDQPTKDELVMNPHESMEMIKIDEAGKLGDTAKAIQNICSVLSALPEVTMEVEPLGVGLSTQFDASKISQGMLLAAAVIEQEAGSRLSDASRAARKATMIRQLQDRRLQANQAGYDIVNTDAQISSQRIKIKLCDAEIMVQERQNAHFVELDDYMRSKYTNEALYAWMDASARQILYQTYQLAMDAARSAEKALSFELSPNATANQVRLASSYWDGNRQGAFAAQNMYMDLKRIENTFLTSQTHDFEITKHVSLRSIDPWALLRLQENGKTEFTLPEVLFDFDFPGHYCRRIRSVQLTIPCIVGPYTSVSCTLRLQEHAYRLRQNLSGAEYYPLGSISSDTRYRTDKIALSSVALSNAQKDAGVFELNFSGNNQYGPFEGAGAVSRWSLELPTVVRQFDYRTISDVVLHVNFTSLDGGAGWQNAASEAVDVFRTSTETRMHTALFDLGDLLMHSASTSPAPQAVLQDVSHQLPFWTRGKTVVVEQCWLAATKDLAIFGSKSAEDMPKLNGHAMLNSRTQEQNDTSGIIEAMGGLDDVIDLAWNATAMPDVAEDLTISIPALKSAKERRSARKLDNSRVWLLLRYKLS